MKALRLNALDGPSGTRVEQIAVPYASDGDVLVRLRSAALNHRDVFIAEGRYPNIRTPVTLGSDGAGEVAALGSAAGGVAVGDEVIIDPMLDWGADSHVWDPGSSILGMPRDGTLAQYVAIPATNVHAKPPHLSMEEAAAIPLAGLTAYRAAVARGALQPGETVLITGIGGGVQTFVLLFAKRIGARAIVTSSSDEKLKRATALGADLAINYAAAPDWYTRIRSEAVDLIVDSSGGETLRRALELVRPGGRIVIYGGTNGDATIKLFPLFWKHVSILGTSMGSPQDFAAMLGLFNDGLRPVVDRVFPLEETAAAMERLAGGAQFGKIVVSVD